MVYGCSNTSILILNLRNAQSKEVQELIEEPSPSLKLYLNASCFSVHWGVDSEIFKSFKQERNVNENYSSGKTYGRWIHQDLVAGFWSFLLHGSGCAVSSWFEPFFAFGSVALLRCFAASKRNGIGQCHVWDLMDWSENEKSRREDLGEAALPKVTKVHMPKLAPRETHTMQRLRHPRMLCLYGTNAQRQKLSRAAKAGVVKQWRLECQSPKNDLNGEEEAVGLDVVFQVLGTNWSQEALGCSRLPFALSTKYFQVFHVAASSSSIATLCLKCSTQDRLFKALKQLRKAHLEVEKQSEVLAEQYALAKKRIKSAQSSAQLAAKLGLYSGKLHSNPSK